MKEAVINDTVVVRGILEYAQRNHVHTIVVGARSTNKNTLAKSLSLQFKAGSKLSAHDIPFSFSFSFFEKC